MSATTIRVEDGYPWPAERMDDQRDCLCHLQRELWSLREAWDRIVASGVAEVSASILSEVTDFGRGTKILVQTAVPIQQALEAIEGAMDERLVRIYDLSLALMDDIQIHAKKAIMGKKTYAAYVKPGEAKAIAVEKPAGKKPPKENKLPKHAMHARGRNRGM